MAYRDGGSEQCGPSREIDVLWVTAGLDCDGDTIAITAATQPSLEEIVQGAIPGIPKVNFHNPFLDYENGEDFMEFFYRAAEGKIEPFILVIEGSIPNEDKKEEGYWRHSEQTEKPVSPSRPVSGSTAWLLKRGPWWEPAHAPPMAEFTLAATTN